MATWSCKREKEHTQDEQEVKQEEVSKQTNVSSSTHPFIAINRPDALLHDTELSYAQLFVDSYRVRRNDMFVGRRCLAAPLVHQHLICIVVRVLPAGRRVELQWRIDVCSAPQDDSRR